MGGLSGLGRNIGAGISGFNSVIDRQRRMTLEDADAGWQQQSRQRQQQQWQRDDQERALMDEARAAGIRVMSEDQRAYQTEATRAVPGPTVDGGPVPRAPMPAYRPKDQAILRAARAEYDTLFLRGRQDLGMRKYAEAAGLRTRLQEQAGMAAMRALQSGGDFITPFKELDEQMDDGLDAQIEEVRGPNGERAFKVAQTNRFSGKALGPPTTHTQQQMQMIIAQRMADPKATIELNFKSYLESLKATNDKDNDERTNKLAMDRDAANRSSAEQVARGNNAATINAAQIRAGAAGRGSAAERTEGARLLREERLAAESEVRGLTDQLTMARRPQERAALQAQLTEARQRVRDIGDKAGRMGSDRSAGAPKLMPKRMPTSKNLLVTGELYDTARGPAKWNGSAFELEGR